MKLNLAGEEIDLLPEKAFFWKKENLLGFSDVHLGKAESLQSYGLPIPSGGHIEDLKKIDSLILKTNPQKIFILGDLIHQKNSWTDDLLKDLKTFFNNYSKIEFSLLIGNHERGSADQLKKLPINLIEDDFSLAPFLLTHGHKKNESGLFQIQGHVHPVVKLEQGSTRLRLPCFIVTENALTLPSFGSMTGGFEIRPNAKQNIYAIAESNVFKVLK